MKQLLYTLLLLLPLSLSAQVQKEVEVSKSYVPRVAPATKLALQPDFTDTVKLRPEIDYTIQPRALNTQLESRTFRPATVTYWEFNRPSMGYLKAGVGAPLNSLADLRIATQNPSIGYALLYLNHEGDYAKVRNAAGKHPTSTRMYNRIGAAAGRYLGRHTLEADLSYENYLTHRYGATDPTDDWMVGSRINYGEAELRIRLGDDFNNSEKVNFNVEGWGLYLHDNSQNCQPTDLAQVDAGGRGRIDFRRGGHRIGIVFGFEGAWGLRDSQDENLNFRGELSYSFAHRSFDAEVGMTYHYSKVRCGEQSEGFHYPIPHLRLKFNVGDGVFVPYVGFDSEIERNDFRSLLRENPYTTTGLWLPKNTVSYNLRAGVEGNLSNRLSYRLHFTMSWLENARYWYGVNLSSEEQTSNNYLQFAVAQARRNTATIGAELKWRPATDWLIQGSVTGYLHDFTAQIEGHDLCGGLPALESKLKVSYHHRKFTIRAAAELQSTRYWSNLKYDPAADAPAFSIYKLPITVDLSLGADYHLNTKWSLFLEGRNLLNERLHDWANYPLTGIGFTIGAILNF